MKKLFRLALGVVLIMLVLALGGYSLGSFGNSMHLKDPSVLFDNLPSVGDIADQFEISDDIEPSQEKLDQVIEENKEKDSTTDLNDLFKDAPYNQDNNSSTDSSFNTTPSSSIEDLFKYSPYKVDGTSDGINFFSVSSDDDKNGLDSITFAIAKTYKITYGDKEFELSINKTFDFVKWLHQNYSDDANISVEVIAEQPEQVTSPTDTPSEEDELTPTEEPIEVNDTTSYDRVLNNVRDLNTLAASINIVKELPKGDGYDRNTFEKPVKSYKYQYKDKTTGELVITNQKMNRNDYSWMTSKYLESLVPLKYICPYTGKVLLDLDDDKEDGDFGNLDYDHIVPLKSAYRRGADKWSDAKKNEYAYDQWVGVDVTASANRSKSDKGPLEYMPDINKEDYCYSWILICSKYGLSMTQEELDLCVNTIKEALASGETVEHMGGSYREN